MPKLTTWLNAAINSGSATLDENDPKKRVIRGINLMALSIIGLNLTMGIFVYFISFNFRVLAGICVETPLLVLTPLLNRRGLTTAAGMVVYAVMSFATLYYGSILGRSVNAVLMIPFLLAICLFMFREWYYRLVSILLAITILIFLELDYTYNYIPPIDISAGQAELQKWSAYAAILMLIIVSYALYSRNYREALNQIQKYARQKESESECKDKFISNASHEMRVSFKSIFAIINILKKRVEPLQSRELATIVYDLQTSCDISQNIVDNVLEYEKIQAGMNTPNRNNSFDARILFGNTTEVYRYLASEKNIRITGLFERGMPRHIIADDIKIRHIYTNLLHNAIKFSPNDSEITVIVKTTSTILVFRVEDHGDGITDQSRLYQAFASTNPEGLGLGLFIVRELVNNLHGEINMCSSEQGTTFTVGIPLCGVSRAAGIVQRESLS